MLGLAGADVIHIEAGVDYITMTMPTDEMYSSQWWEQCMQFLEEEQDNGSTVKQATILGYNGALVGQVFVGQRDDGIICRASGASAARVFAGLYNPFVRVSRLDIQTTIWTSDRAFNIGPEAGRAAKEWNRHPSGAIKRSVSEITGNDGGYTLYVGKRSSTSFLRLYDKNAQSKDERYTNAWRYEVQVQSAPANKLAEALTRAKGSLEGAIAATVHEYCTERGISPVYSKGMAAIVVASQEVGQTDVVRMLLWLQKQVKPTVDRLKRMGYTADVAEIFGLKEEPAEQSGAHD